MIIRQAITKDLPVLLEAVEAFMEYYPATINFDAEHISTLLTELIASQVVLVAYSGEVFLGTIIGVVAPHPYDPTSKIGTELCWWIVPEHRNTTAAIKLLKKFEQVMIQEGATQIAMTTTIHTPTLPRVFKKLGYSEAETSFIKEV